MNRKQLVVPGTILAAVVMAVLVIALNSVNEKKVAQEKSPKRQTQEKTVAPEKDPDYTYYYIGTISILETQKTDMRGQMIHSSIDDIAFDSEELLIYDVKTQKCYIIGRRLTFKSNLLVTEIHPYFGTMTQSGKRYCQFSH
ncbi:MAG: hypothetical protein ACOX4U_08015 [Anaerovoracaceae bacterium]|jgi:hypothetical protein